MVFLFAVPNAVGLCFEKIFQSVGRMKTSMLCMLIGCVVSAVSVTVSGALEGLGKGIQSLIISLIRYIVAILPLAFILSRILGTASVRHAFWITEIIAAAISWIICKKEFFK